MKETSLLSVSRKRYTVAAAAVLLCLAFIALQTWSDSKSPPEQRWPRPHGGDNTACRWIFKKYIPSAFELQWRFLIAGDPRAQHICFNMHDASMGRKVHRLLRLTLALSRRETWSPTDEALNDMSRMEYVTTCRGKTELGVQLVEPLYGILRAPCDSYCDRSNKCPEDLKKDSTGQSKMHVLTLVDAPFDVGRGWEVGVAPWHCPAQDACDLTRMLIMDIGASRFDQWTKGVEGHTDTAGSQSWLYARYSRNNIMLERFYAFEATALDPSDVFGKLPAHLLHKYHWVNAPVTAAVGDRLNPLTTLINLRELGRRYLTIVKLDIDTPSIEGELIQQLLTDSESQTGIHELFYEHHVNMIPMNDAWLTFTAKETLLDSFDMFSKLRQMGIRAQCVFFCVGR